MRLSGSGSLFALFFFGEHLEYSDAPSVDYEEFFSITASYSQPTTSEGKWGLEANYFYMHQIYDVSEILGSPQRLLLLGHGLTLTPSVEHTIEDYTLSIEGDLSRQIYELTLDNYWQASGRSTISYAYGNKAEVAIYYQYLQRYFDTLEQYDGTGAILPDTNLMYQQHELAGTWLFYLDQNRYWRMKTKLGAMMNLDNGEGYFDYDRFLFKQQIRWKKDKWSITGNIHFSNYFYKKQPAGTKKLQRSSTDFSMQAGRKITDHWSVGMECEYLWSNSNDPLDQYEGWALRTGVRYEF